MWKGRIPCSEPLLPVTSPKGVSYCWSLDHADNSLSSVGSPRNSSGEGGFETSDEVLLGVGPVGWDEGFGDLG